MATFAESGPILGKMQFRARFLLVVALLSTAATPALPGQTRPPDASLVTEGSLGMERAFKLLFAPTWPGDPPDRNPKERALFLLVDPTPSVAASPLLLRLRAALPAFLKTCAVGVAGIGRPRKSWLPPTKDASAILAAVRGILAKTDKGYHDVFETVRKAAPLVAKAAPARALLCISFENGDLESRLEGTAKILRQKSIRFFGLTTEAMLADSYWASRLETGLPKRAVLRGGDAGFIDLPWGWILQDTIPNEVTPSGFGPYSFGRLAAASGGRVFLHSEGGGRHECAVYLGTCLFCSDRDDHVQPDETYWDGRLRLLAPSVDARRRIAKTLGGDPWFRAVRKAWLAAWKAGFLAGRPEFDAGTTSGPSLRSRGVRGLEFLSSLSFRRNAGRADKKAAECVTILRAFENDLSALDPDAGSPRSRAIAAWTRLALKLLELNLRGYAGWCREIAPKLLEEELHPPPPPEVRTLALDRRPVGVSFQSMSLCHGVAPFFEVDLPGGPAFRKNLLELDRMARAFFNHYGHTPFAVAFRRMGIARFHLVYEGIVVAPRRKRPKSKRKEPPATTTPVRRGRSGTGRGGRGGAGPSTGGGR